MTELLRIVADEHVSTRKEMFWMEHNKHIPRIQEAWVTELWFHESVMRVPIESNTRSHRGLAVASSRIHRDIAGACRCLL